jgi:Flp pilus assembly protein TadB
MSARVEDFAHIVQVTFDRVFDVQGSLFSFESGGKKEYGVNFSDGTVPRDGSRYAIALVERGNWQKVVGWRDLSTPDVVLAESAWDVALAQAWIVYWFGPFFVLGALLFLGGWVALAVLLLFLWAAVYFVRQARERNRLVDQALRDIPPAAPPGNGPRIGKTGKTWLTGVLGIVRWWP